MPSPPPQLARQSNGHVVPVRARANWGQAARRGWAGSGQHRASETRGPRASGLCLRSGTSRRVGSPAAAPPTHHAGAPGVWRPCGASQQAMRRRKAGPVPRKKDNGSGAATARARGTEKKSFRDTKVARPARPTRPPVHPTHPTTRLINSAPLARTYLVQFVFNLGATRNLDDRIKNKRLTVSRRVPVARQRRNVMPCVRHVRRAAGHGWWRKKKTRRAG